MNGILFIIIFFIGFNILKSVLSAGSTGKKKKQVRRRRHTNKSSRQNVWQSSEDNAQGGKSSRGFKANWQQAAMQEARRKIEDQRDDRSTRRKDPADQNRNRTADWGSRAGPGLLNSKTLIILVAVIIIGIYLSRQYS